MDFDRIKETFTLASGASAGIACLSSIIKYYGGEVSDEMLLQWSREVKSLEVISVNEESQKRESPEERNSDETADEQVTLDGMKEAATCAGFHANIRLMTIDQLMTMQAPLILFFENECGLKDFSVCYGFDGNRFVVGEPSFGLMQYMPGEMKDMWIEGIALVLIPDSKSKKDNICVYVK